MLGRKYTFHHLRQESLDLSILSPSKLRPPADVLSHLCWVLLGGCSMLCRLCPLWWPPGLAAHLPHWLNPGRFHSSAWSHPCSHSPGRTLGIQYKATHRLPVTKNFYFPPRLANIRLSKPKSLPSELNLLPDLLFLTSVSYLRGAQLSRRLAQYLEPPCLILVSSFETGNLPSTTQMVTVAWNACSLSPTYRNLFLNLFPHPEMWQLLFQFRS